MEKERELIIGDPVNKATAIVFLVFGLFILVSGVIGNGFLLLVLATQRKLWEVHNIFIANLALADLVVVCTGLPFLLLDLLLGYQPVTNEYHCMVNGFILCVAYSVSILSLVSISFNRYMKVCHTSHFHRLFSFKKNIFYSIGLWALGCLLQIPLLAGYPPYGYDAGSHVCQARSVRDEINYGGMAMSVLLAGPVLMIGYFNYAIFRKWSESRAKVKGQDKQMEVTELKTKFPGKLKSVFYVEYSETSDVSSDAPRSANVTNTSLDTDVTDSSINKINLDTSGIRQERDLAGGHDTYPALTASHSKDVENSQALGETINNPNILFQSSDDSLLQKENSSSRQSRKKLPIRLVRKTSLPQARKGLPIKTRSESPLMTRTWSLPQIRKESIETRMESHRARYKDNLSAPKSSTGQTDEDTDTLEDKLLALKTTLQPKINPAEDADNDITPACSVSNLAAANNSTDKIIFDPNSTKTNETPKSKSLSQGGKMKKMFHATTRAEVALVRSLLVISVCLLVLYMPFAICLLADYGTDVPSELMVFVSLLLFINCAVNWIIYGAMNTSFRQGYIHTIRRLKCHCGCAESD